MKTNEKKVFVEDLRVHFMIAHPEIAALHIDGLRNMKTLGLDDRHPWLYNQTRSELDARTSEINDERRFKAGYSLLREFRQEIADAVETRPNMFKSLLPYETRKRMVNAVETWQWFMRRAQATPTDFKPQCPWDEWRTLVGAYLRATNPSFRR